MDYTTDDIEEAAGGKASVHPLVIDLQTATYLMESYRWRCRRTRLQC